MKGLFLNRHFLMLVLLLGVFAFNALRSDKPTLQEVIHEQKEASVVLGENKGQQAQSASLPHTPPMVIQRQVEKARRAQREQVQMVPEKVDNMVSYPAVPLIPSNGYRGGQGEQPSGDASNNPHLEQQAVIKTVQEPEKNDIEMMANGKVIKNENSAGADGKIRFDLKESKGILDKYKRER